MESGTYASLPPVPLSFRTDAQAKSRRAIHHHTVPETIQEAELLSHLNGRYSSGLRPAEGFAVPLLSEQGGPDEKSDTLRT